MDYSLEVFGSAVVALGSFAPPQYSPEWLEQVGLIGRDDAEFAKSHESLVRTPEVSVLETEWARLQVVADNFSVTSKGPLTPAFRDLVVGIMSLIPQSPVRALGINFISHWRIATLANYHHFGDVMQPKPVWRKAFPDLEPGLQDFGVKLQKYRRGEILTSKDELRIQVQASSIVPNGVFLQFNHHREDTFGDPVNAKAEHAALIVERDWQTLCTEANDKMNEILGTVFATEIPNV